MFVDFVIALTLFSAMTAYAAVRPTFDTSITTIQNLSSSVTVDNNKDGTITLHMPNLSSTTVVAKSVFLTSVAVSHTLHYGYKKDYDDDMSSVSKQIAGHLVWGAHTPFTELDKVVDITSGQPIMAVLVVGHLSSACSCPAPMKDVVFCYFRYTNPVKVTYNLNGGNIQDSTDNKVEYLFEGDTLQTTFAEPVLANYVFDGWYTEAKGGTKVTAKTGQSATNYYAHWTQNEVPKTGDNSNTVLYLVLLTASVGVLVLYFRKRIYR